MLSEFSTILSQIYPLTALLGATLRENYPASAKIDASLSKFYSTSGKPGAFLSKNGTKLCDLGANLR
jgi:hypothetical protein